MEVDARSVLNRPALPLLSRARNLCLLTVAALMLMGAVAGVARASSVTNVVAAIAPTDAASAPTVYTTSFTATTGLSGSQNATVTLTFPPITGLSDLTNAGIVTDNSQSGQPQVGGDCSNTSSTIETCVIFGGSSVNAGDTVTVELDGVVNSSRPSTNYHVSVSTSADTTAASSNALTVASAQSVTNVTVTNSPPTTATNARTVYKTTFTTSSTGGMSGAAGSTITLSFPSGTGLSNLGNAGIVTDNTVSGKPQVGGDCSNTSSTIETCVIFGGSSVNAGDSVTVELDGVLNPATPSTPGVPPYTLTLSTTSDRAGAATSNSYTVASAQSVSNVTVTNTPPTTATSAPTVYKTTFTTSSTGGMSGAAGSSISITFPSGTNVGKLTNAGIVTDNTTSGHPQVGGDCSFLGSSVTCVISNGSSVAGGDSVTVELDGVINPATPSGANNLYSASVMTSSDNLAATPSNTYTVLAAQSVSNVTVTNTPPTTATNAPTVYKTTFTTSSTGGMSGAAGSTITITFPSGTGLSKLTNAGKVTDNTTSGQPEVGGDCSNPSGTTETCVIFGGSSVNAGDSVTVELDGVTNPATTSTTDTVSVSTTSDHASVTPSNTYTVLAAQSVSNVTVTNTPPTPATNAPTVYKTTFTTSSTGGMSGAAGSTITITFPSGTGLSKLTNAGKVTDNTTSGQPEVGGDCSNTSGTTETCVIFGGSSVNAGDSATVELDGVVNPSPTTTATASVSTTSDHAGATPSGQYTVLGQHSVTGVSVGLSNSTPGASGVTYKTTFTTSATGGMSGAAGSTITQVFPSGTGLTHLSNAGAVTDNTASGHPVVGGDCSNPSGTTETCVIFGGSSVNAGDSVTVELDGVTNPTTTSTSDIVAVSTTSDQASVNSAPYGIGSPAVTGISPTSGPTGGGTSVTISGTSLAGATSVKLGTANATNVAVVSSTQITATSPAGSGTVDVTVTTPAGTSASSAANQYTYLTGPGVTGVSPAAGPTGGGNTVTITGSSLANATAVKFGTATATIKTDIATSITATAPAGSAGTVDITVTTALGTSPTSAADRYTYLAAPTVTGINPTSGPTGGGTAVTITGTNFAGTPTIKFGANAATNISVVTSSQITATSPAGSAATVDVTVTTPGGTSATGAADQFTYNAQPSSPPPVQAPFSPPIVSGGSPTTETVNGAAVSGTVNPESLVTTAFFQYGLDPSDRGPGASTTLYDQSTPVQTVGADSAIHTVSASLTGLVPGALYHIRLVATNSDGTTFGTESRSRPRTRPRPRRPCWGRRRTQRRSPGRCSSNRRRARSCF